MIQFVEVVVAVAKSGPEAMTRGTVASDLGTKSFVANPRIRYFFGVVDVSA